MANPLVVRNRRSSGFELDRGTHRELMAQTNRMVAQTELGRQAMQAISHTVVYSQYQVAQALAASSALEERMEAELLGEESLTYCRLLRFVYLQQMAATMQKNVEAITQLLA